MSRPTAPSVYRRKKRTCWYVSYISAEQGKRVDESSGVPIGEDEKSSRVEAMAYARSREERAAVYALNQKECFDTWAEDWLKAKYSEKNHAKTRTSYLCAWKHLSLFLHDNKVFTPRQLTFDHVQAFVTWRESQVKRQSGKKVSRNTALHNVRVLSRLMTHATQRGYCQGNPCLRTGKELARDKPERKSAFTDPQITMIRRELERRRGVGRPSDWMEIAFEIALHQGCRLAATQIKMDNIDFDRWTILFTEKGHNGKPAEFTVPVNEGLKPLLTRLRDEGRDQTCVLPIHASRNFVRVLATLGLKNHSFRSTRISVITRMAKGNVNEQKARRFVHHASSTIHSVYQRLQPADVTGVAESLCLPPRDSGPAPLPLQTADDRRAISRLARGSNKTP